MGKKIGTGRLCGNWRIKGKSWRYIVLILFGMNVVSKTCPSQRPAQLLLAFDRLEQRLEITLAEALRAAPLDHFEEQRGSIGDRLGEDLQHVAFVVAVDQDAEVGQLVHVFLDGADAVGQHV